VPQNDNVYKVPSFFKNYNLSNDMIYIIVKLLHQNPQYRFQSLKEVRDELIKLEKNIVMTPLILRQLVSHPILPGENFQPDLRTGVVVEEEIDLRECRINEFSLKYLAKFIRDHAVANLAINGGHMPLSTIKAGNLKLLNLSEQGLYSEDLFILSQFLSINTSITHINLSKNFIGQRCLNF
jgi:hypothetical protein